MSRKTDAKCPQPNLPNDIDAKLKKALAKCKAMKAKLRDQQKGLDKMANQIRMYESFVK